MHRENGLVMIWFIMSGKVAYNTAPAQLKPSPIRDNTAHGLWFASGGSYNTAAISYISAFLLHSNQPG